MIMSMISGTGALSTERLTGLMASVGSNSHLEWVGMDGPSTATRVALFVWCNRLHYSSIPGLSIESLPPSLTNQIGILDPGSGIREFGHSRDPTMSDSG